VKYLLGEASPEEEQAVTGWMKDNETHQEYYNQFKKIWDQSKALALESNVDVNKAWERFQNRISEEMRLLKF
jgi:transmembrane sensor